MTNKAQVVVYGASGYTGMLIIEHLIVEGIPFIAAGRDKQRIAQLMKERVPGLESARYEIAEVTHEKEDLVRLFKGATVVCNTVGPFADYCWPVIEAALEAGCHYMDTTGEQECMLTARDEYGERFAEKNLVFAQSVAYMFSVLEAAAELCLENPAIDTIDAACVPTNLPTVGSTNSIFNLFRATERYLLDNEYQQWEPKTSSQVVVPGVLKPIMAMPWGGGSLPIIYEQDSRVRTCRQLSGFYNEDVTHFVLNMWNNYDANIKSLPKDEQDQKIAEICHQLTPEMPSRERSTFFRNVDHVLGRGNTATASCTVFNHSGYAITGLLQALVVRKLICDDIGGKPGFTSACKMVGHRYLLDNLAVRGFASYKVSDC